MNFNWTDLDNTLDVVEQLRNTGSTKEKGNILKANVNDEALQKVLTYTYNSFKRYGVSEEVYNNIPICTHATIYQTPYEMFNELASSNINDILREKAKYFIEVITPEQYRELIKGILFKDLKLGVNAKSINKVWKGLIPTFDVQLAESFSKVGFKYIENKNIYITPKMDGFRCVFIPSEQTFLSRKGQEFEGINHLLKDCENLVNAIKVKTGEICVLDGELVHKQIEGKDSLELYALTSSITRKKGCVKEKEQLVFHVFDIIPVGEFMSGHTKWCYSKRREVLEDIFNNVSYKNVLKVPVITQGNLTEEEIINTLNNTISKGEEGIMINLDKPYETKRTKSLLKVKKFLDADVYVKSMYEGAGKHKGRMGGINILFKYCEKEYECQLGSGFSDEERELYWNNPDELVGKVVEIQLFEVSRNSQTGDYGLRFPTWKGRIRFDKGYEEITDLG